VFWHHSGRVPALHRWLGTISKLLDRRLVIEELKMALDPRNPPPRTIHRLDRGVQYACKEYLDLLTLHQFKISMSRSGNPYDNPFAESLMKTLKKEEVYLWNARASLMSLKVRLSQAAFILTHYTSYKFWPDSLQ
jgi:transposase InsO family protein